MGLFVCGKGDETDAKETEEAMFLSRVSQADRWEVLRGA